MREWRLIPVMVWLIAMGLFSLLFPLSLPKECFVKISFMVFIFSK
jgi:hypothetical protein